VNPYLAAFLAGLASLGLEVLLVRVLAFLLSSGMDFLAIPLALLGLAIGSVYAHYFWRRPIISGVDPSPGSSGRPPPRYR
jgi:hypothetical protein